MSKITFLNKTTAVTDSDIERCFSFLNRIAVREPLTLEVRDIISTSYALNIINGLRKQYVAAFYLEATTPSVCTYHYYAAPHRKHAWHEAFLKTITSKSTPKDLEALSDLFSFVVEANKQKIKEDILQLIQSQPINL